jgi:hypothetical protein
MAQRQPANATALQRMPRAGLDDAKTLMSDLDDGDIGRASVQRDQSV